MPELASVNGHITPIAEARVSIDDRGFLFGDGVYEVIVSYHNKLFLLAEHLKRLRRSLDCLRMSYVGTTEIVEQVQKVFTAAAMPRAKVYIQITRGYAPRRHHFPDPQVKPTVVITVREFPPMAEDLFEDGVSCITRPDIRWGRVDIKTVNLLPNCLAKQEAVEHGCFEAIFVSPEDIVREATAANLFIIRDGRVLSHPADERILSGITRQVILDLAAQAGLRPEERTFTRQEMMEADEVFLSGTTTEVMPVVHIDNHLIQRGDPGPHSRRLLKLFREWTAKNNR